MFKIRLARTSFLGMLLAIHIIFMDTTALSCVSMTRSHTTIVVARQCQHTSLPNHLSVEGLGRVGADSE